MQKLADLPLKERDRQAIDAVVSLLQSQFPVEKVILYGSKVSGQDTDESDIDLLVLTQHPLPWQQRNAITDALFDIELAHDVVISTLVVAQSDWLSGYYTRLPIHQEISQQGVAA